MITVIGSLKGGSGKSTVTFNLALWLARAGKTVLTYDLDPQCTLSDVMQLRREEDYQPNFKVYNRYNRPQQKHAPEEEVLIDVGAANMQGMRRAIALSDRVVIPVTPSQADIWSAQRFLYIIASAITERPPTVLAFINRADTHSSVRESDQAEEALRILPGIKVLGGIRLCQRTTYRRSFSEGLAVFELEPTGKAAQEFETFAMTLYGSIKATSK
jgi:chromosome partitioning protein